MHHTCRGSEVSALESRTVYQRLVHRKIVEQTFFVRYQRIYDIKLEIVHRVIFD